MAVNRCICHQITFSEIKQIAEERGITSVEELAEHNISSTNCQLCKPYLKKMFETGKTSFDPGIIYEKVNGS
jgi:bacterioferritin-associated ferredoxin